jgi:WD40 repeat protein
MAVAGSRLFTAGRDGAVSCRTFAPPTGARRRAPLDISRETVFFAGHIGAVLDVAYSPESSLIISSGTDKTLRLFDYRGKEGSP